MDAEILLTKLEMILRENVADNFPQYWDENHITLSILKEFGRALNMVKIDDFGRKMKIEWNAFKLKGKNETKFGDVAILVNVVHYDGDRMEGVAFLEAKKRYPRGVEFTSINQDQVSRILKNAPRSMALLYDYDGVTQFADIEGKSKRWEWFEWKRCTCCVTVPMNILSVLNKKDITLYKFSLPFSYQLVFRYFQGFDLEFEKQPVAIAKGFSREMGTPTYLVIASLSQGRHEPDKSIEYNSEIYAALE